MENSFYNTISFSGEDLKEANAKTLYQEDLIAAIFKANPDKQLSPSQVHSIVQLKYDLNWPLTSVRRAMSNLTKRDNVLVKTENMVEGSFGKPEYCWKLKQENIYKPGQKSAGDIAVDLLKGGIQQNLFGQ